MSGRKLRLLQIDDLLNAQDESSASLFPALEIISYQNGDEIYTAINSWKTALYYWQSFHDNLVPDLILSDVQFFDQSSPLSFYADGKDSIPTGLSHAKAFAAMSRASGKPIGMGIHTGDSFAWKLQLYKNKDLPDQQKLERSRMALLAAHEIGEIASILGDNYTVYSSKDKNQKELQLNEAWEWLEKRISSTVSDALSFALNSYRKQILQKSYQVLSAPSSEKKADTGLENPYIFIMPDEWIRLASWCEQMQNSKTQKALSKNDPGVALTSLNGKTDRISILSLFCDADIEDDELEQEINISRYPRPLPAKCYTLKHANNAAELDEEGLPQIGAFIYQLGWMNRTYDKACEALHHFPVSPEPLQTHLGDQLPLESERQLIKVARGLAVIFQIIRRDMQNTLIWKDLYLNSPWIPYQINEKDLKLIGSFCNESQNATLEQTLQSLHNLITDRIKTGQFFNPDDVLWEKNWMDIEVKKANAGWIHWHFERMADLGILSIHPFKEEKYQLTSSENFPVNRVPALPDISDLPGGIKIIGKNSIGYLMETLGYSGKYGPNKNDTPQFVNSTLRDAFQLSGNQAISFRERFFSDSEPSWLAEICRQFALEKLDWYSKSEWPVYLRS